MHPISSFSPIDENSQCFNSPAVTSSCEIQGLMMLSAVTSTAGHEECSLNVGKRGFQHIRIITFEEKKIQIT